MTMKVLDLTPEELRARDVLHFLKKVSGLSDQDIAARAGWKRHQSVQQRRYGQTRIHPWRDVPRLAEALKVEPACFAMNDEDLHAWIRDNRPDLLKFAIGWFSIVAA